MTFSEIVPSYLSFKHSTIDSFSMKCFIFILTMFALMEQEQEQRDAGFEHVAKPVVQSRSTCLPEDKVKNKEDVNALFSPLFEFLRLVKTSESRIRIEVYVSQFDDFVSSCENRFLSCPEAHDNTEIDFSRLRFALCNEIVQKITIPLLGSVVGSKKIGSRVVISQLFGVNTKDVIENLKAKYPNMLTRVAEAISAAGTVFF
eukprot:NODE_121_length_18880_cov_0.205687.p6 type:complete len:202 gc:universal NODE_121_length_18880_cov_0.205687:9536-8931(-)